MKKNRKTWALFCAVAALFLSGCENGEARVANCVEAAIPANAFYRAVYRNCFDHTMWLEVSPAWSIGRDVAIFTPFPILFPTPPILYPNAIEVPRPEEVSRSMQPDTLFGKKVYFRYRQPTEAELRAFRTATCNEVYAAHPLPFFMLTYFSFSRCAAD